MAPLDASIEGGVPRGARGNRRCLLARAAHRRSGGRGPELDGRLPTPSTVPLGTSTDGDADDHEHLVDAAGSGIGCVTIADPDASTAHLRRDRGLGSPDTPGRLADRARPVASIATADSNGDRLDRRPRLRQARPRRAPSSGKVLGARPLDRHRVPEPAAATRITCNDRSTILMTVLGCPHRHADARPRPRPPTPTPTPTPTRDADADPDRHAGPTPTPRADGSAVRRSRPRRRPTPGAGTDQPARRASPTRVADARRRRAPAVRDGVPGGGSPAAGDGRRRTGEAPAQRARSGEHRARSAELLDDPGRRAGRQGHGFGTGRAPRRRGVRLGGSRSDPDRARAPAPAR